MPRSATVERGGPSVFTAVASLATSAAPAFAQYDPVRAPSAAAPPPAGAATAKSRRGNPVLMIRRLSPIVIATGIALATPARAEVVTLECTNISLPGGTPYTADIDFATSVVRELSTTYRIDQVTDRYIYYGSSRHIYGAIGSPFRIDRKTGMQESQNVVTHEFAPIAKCIRLEGNVF